MGQTAPWRRPRRVAEQGATGDMKTADTRVLVLDDDPFMCEALAIALGSEGYNVRTETDGTTINQSFSEFRPAVAVVDVNLGDGPDGFSVTRRLRAMSDLPGDPGERLDQRRGPALRASASAATTSW